MKASGELLKKTRLEKNLTLEELSAQTKIQVAILKKIEEGLISELPHKTIIRGFIKHYARSMNMNVDEVLGLYDDEVSSGPKPKPMTVAVPNKSSDPAQNTIGNKTNLLWFRTSSNFVTLLGIGIVVLLLAAIYFFSLKMISYSEETYRKPEAKEEVTTPTELQNIVAPSPPPKSPESANPPVEEKNSPAETAPSNSTETKAEPQTPPTEETDKSPSAVEKPKMVVVEAFESVIINATWSTGKKEKISLKTNRKHTFYYSEKISLKIDNAGGVSIVTSKEKLGIPGELGKEIVLSFE